MDKAIRHIVILSFHGVPDVVRLEVKPVATEVKHSNVLALLHFSHFETELWDFFRKIVQTLQSLLFLLLLIHFLSVDLHLLSHLLTDIILRLICFRKVHVIELRPLLRKLVISIEIRDLFLSQIDLFNFIDHRV